MRSFVIAPTDVHSNTLFGDVGESAVERLDMGLGDLDELLVGIVFELEN